FKRIFFGNKFIAMPTPISRRKFLGNVSVGAGTIGLPGYISQTENKNAAVIPPSQVNVATVSIMDISASDTPDMIQKVLGIMEDIVPYQPDIICLPEIFAFANIARQDYQLKDVAEKVPGPVVTPFLKFAATHKCYIICPTYSMHEGNIYISAVLIDRRGQVVGEYHKMRPAESELKMGIKPGKFDPPVFQTDFGKIGIQICFDIKYEDGWNVLKDKGAQIIFWPSAYAAGQEISSRAWRHQVYIATSTQKDTSKICDITGETIVQTGRWQRNWVCAPVNLEKAFILTWPAVSFFPDIQKKYGSRIKLTTFSEEEWTIIESLDAGLKIADVLKEYNLKTMHEALKELGAAHDKAREK
ncbi:MAG: carbon-nitrogen hydrolase family protein, partial [Bacteroidota bacterium]